MVVVSAYAVGSDSTVVVVSYTASFAVGTVVHSWQFKDLAVLAELKLFRDVDMRVDEVFREEIVFEDCCFTSSLKP